jgi:uncharacterized protein (DUF362 family)
MKMTRRDFVPIAAAGLFAGYAGLASRRKNALRISGTSPVAVVKAAAYTDDLVSRMLEGIRACGLDVKGQRVLLKPNLVEFDSATCINTDVTVVAAAYEVFRGLGASEVLIGEGPGHRRDTYAIAEMARYRGELSGFDSLFVDLNRDDVSPIEGFADRGRIYLPNTALRADLIVSLAKMKTHHWAGATLSMKNYFGLVPGSVYGWPKNELHHVGIPTSIVELNRVFHHSSTDQNSTRRSFAIVDGVVGMEGNGPIQGTPKPVGVLVMGRDLPAVDATCCRIMGIDPRKVEYLRMAEEQNLGLIDEARVEQRGEPIASVRTNFQLIREFHNLRLT